MPSSSLSHVMMDEKRPSHSRESANPLQRMTLSDTQKALGKTLLEPAGLGMLDATPKAWQKFVQAQAPALWGASQERLKLYQDLLVYSIYDTLANMFPYTRRFIQHFWSSDPDQADSDVWMQLAEYFRREYPNRSYQLYLALKDFPAFIATTDHPLVAPVRQTYPFLASLALYEWQEVAVINDPEVDVPDGMILSLPDSIDETWLKAHAPVWNTASRLDVYDYNIPLILEALKAGVEETEAHASCCAEQEESYHEESSHDQAHGGIPEGFMKTVPAAANPSPTPILIYQDIETFEPRFFVLSPLAAQLVALADVDQSPRQSIEALFEALKTQVPALAQIPEATLTVQGFALLRQLMDVRMLLGLVAAV